MRRQGRLAWYDAALPGPAGEPLDQVPVTLPPVRGRQRRTVDRPGERPDVFVVQPGRRMAQPAGAARVHVGTAAPHRRMRPLRALGMIPPEVEPVRDLVKPAIKAQFGDDRAVRVVIALLHRRAAQHLGPDDAVVVVTPTAEQQAPEPLRRTGGGRVERVPVRVGHRARAVDPRAPGMRQHHIRVLIECIDTAFDQLTGVQIIARRPLEQLTPGLLDDHVVVRGEAHVGRLADVAHPRVLLYVALADVSGAVGRCVVGNDQLEILVGLAEQGIERFGEVRLAVIDRQPNGEPGRRAHCTLCLVCRGSDGSLNIGSLGPHWFSEFCRIGPRPPTDHDFA